MTWMRLPRLGRRIRAHEAELRVARPLRRRSSLTTAASTSTGISTSTSTGTTSTRTSATVLVVQVRGLRDDPLLACLLPLRLVKEPDRRGLVADEGVLYNSDAFGAERDE